MLVPTFELVVGLILLVWGADRFVSGAAAVAGRFGVSPLLIGLTIVALSTSAPEILVAIVAAWQGDSDLAVGNAIGSNIVNIGLVLGLMAIISPIQITSATVRREMPILLAVTLLSVSLFLDSYLSRVDGLIQLLSLGIIMTWLCKIGMRSSADDPIHAECVQDFPPSERFVSAAMPLAIGMIALLAGAELLVDGASTIARNLGVSDVVIGIVLVAFATSLPELAVSVTSALRHEYGLALGNIVGSNIYNSLAVIGVAAIIEPAPLPPSVLSMHVFVMVAFTLVLYAATYDYGGKERISRLEGIAMVVAFLAYQTHTIAPIVVG